MLLSHTAGFAHGAPIGVTAISQAEEKQVETNKLLPYRECKLLLTPEEQWVPLERNNLSVTDLLIPP